MLDSKLNSFLGLPELKLTKKSISSKILFNSTLKRPLKRKSALNALPYLLPATTKECKSSAHLGQPCSFMS